MGLNWVGAVGGLRGLQGEPDELSDRWPTERVWAPSQVVLARWRL